MTSSKIIGDQHLSADTHEHYYSSYFNGCQPVLQQANDIIVESVELNIREQLSKLNLGQ
jgi:hypothetical protein